MCSSDLDGDGPEHLRHTACGADGGVGTLGEFTEAGVTGGDIALAVGDADDRFREIIVLESDGAQHGAIGGALIALGDTVAISIECALIWGSTHDGM